MNRGNPMLALSHSVDRDYPSIAVSAAHPVRLRAWASKHGLGGWSNAPFRYLELGCGNATNLLPLAARFPDAEFVGVDRDKALIEKGRAAAEQSGVSNVRLVASDVRELDELPDPFDFVVAHGLFSWVPEDVQERIFTIAKRSLAPFGVAYISFNTFPGWSVRGLVRDMMLDAARGKTTATDRLRLAKARLAELARHTVQPEHPFSQLFSAELDFAVNKPDGYLLEEHLAEHNRPLYFRDFARRAEQHGLKYVCELVPATANGAVELELPAKLALSGMSRIEAEQCLDILTYRQFRATLLCHDQAIITEDPNFFVLAESGWFAAALTPSMQEPLLGPGKALRFRTAAGAEIESTRPLLKAALLALAEAWPAGLRGQELVGAAISALRERGLLESAAIDEAEINRTLRDIIELCGRRFIELLPWSPVICREVTTSPAVHAVTRVEAERTGIVTTPRHDPAVLEEATRIVASLLDGTRDLRALVRELSARLDSGELALRTEAAPDRAQALAAAARRAVLELRDLGLLVVPPEAP